MIGGGFMKRKIILQALDWRLKDIKNSLEEIKKAGFNTVQTSPLQGIKENNGHFWIYYQPTNYKIGNPLGSREELKELCATAKEIGIDIIVDVVFHHIANYMHNDLSDKVDPEIRNIKDLWYDTSFTDIRDYNSGWECTHLSLGGLPALNLSSKELRKLQFNYLIDLRECGVSGARFDALKHLAYENGYFEEMRETVGSEFINNSYGECIDCSHETLRFYQQFIKCGTNIGVSKDETNLVLWVYSHDDENTFGKKMRDDIINSEFRFLRDNYKADILYYARKFNDAWKYI
jgi:glycosidase